MKRLSLSLKLTAASLAIIFLLASVLVWRSYAGISQLSHSLESTTEQNLSAAIQARLHAEAQAYGEQMAGYLNSAFRISSLLEGVIEDSLTNQGTALTRDELNGLIGSVIRSNPDLSSAYAYFEPNGYDGLDDFYKDAQQLHSRNYRGNFDSYWRRTQDGQVVQEAVDVDEKYLDAKNEFGQRESEWYLCAQDTKQPCVMEPFAYSLGQETIVLTTLNAPLLVNNQFRGIAGVDIELQNFQRLTEQLSQALYGGEAKATLLSAQGLIVGSSHFQSQQLRPLTAAMPNRGELLSQLHKQQKYFEDETSIYLAQPLTIEKAKVEWSLLIELPKAVVMASLEEQKLMASEQRQSTLTGQIIIGLALAGISMLIILLLLRSITRPLQVLNQQIYQLASAEGDLSQRLNLDTHAELISLGKNFNSFMEKLRDLVLSLKEIGEQVRTQAAANMTISQQTNASTEQQQGEINNVVTATQEMSATSSEVARIAAEVSSEALGIREQVTATQNSLSLAADLSEKLTENMGLASESINQVSARSDDINHILEVIGSIAEQTNLLALNAAIEAARAGEQGRGFAVVADEVRTLASRTQDSTTEINTLIQDLQGEVSQAVNIVSQGSQQAQDAMEATQEAYEDLNRVVSAIANISDNISQVATAAEEQSSVSEDISHNLTLIGEAASTLADLGQQARSTGSNVMGQVDDLDARLNSLRT